MSGELTTNKMKLEISEVSSIAQWRRFIEGRRFFINKEEPEMWRGAAVNAKLREKMEKEKPEPCRHFSRKIVDGCLYCFGKSFASDPRSDWWSNDNKIGPEKFTKRSEYKAIFNCVECLHTIIKQIAMVTKSKTQGCPYCVSQKMCDDNCCFFCYNKSFASSKKIKYWDWINNDDNPRLLFLNSTAKRWIKCENCPHSFLISLANLNNGKGCPYCANQKLCDDDDCEMCHNNSFAGVKESRYWDYKKNKVSPRQVFRATPKKYYFLCPDCPHSFYSILSNISCHGRWCPYCTNQKLCDNNHCKMCFKNSFASNPISAWWDYKNNKLTPRQVFKSSNKSYYLKCGDCLHALFMKLNDVAFGNRCKYCRGYVCGKEDCHICDKVCDICLTNKASSISRVKRLRLCRGCYKRNINENPEEAPLHKRSKITLEICVLAELQRQSLETEDTFLLYEPTSWDCAILPGSDRKPDNMWCVDKSGNFLVTAGACKINTSEIGYVLILEVLEHSIEQHSKIRDFSDDKREKEIREIFSPTPVGIVYVVVAHTEHHKAAKEDIFFEKNKNSEYEVLDDRSKAFLERISSVKNRLCKMYTTKSNKTYWIGN